MDTGSTWGLGIGNEGKYERKDWLKTGHCKFFALDGHFLERRCKSTLSGWKKNRLKLLYICFEKTQRALSSARTPTELYRDHWKIWRKNREMLNILLSITEDWVWLRWLYIVNSEDTLQSIWRNFDITFSSPFCSNSWMLSALNVW